MTDFGKLLKSYDQTISAYRNLEKDRVQTAYQSHRLSIISGDIFLELHEYKKKYGENKKYTASLERYQELNSIHEAFDKMITSVEKYRIAYRELSGEFAAVCNTLELTEKQLATIQKEHRETLLKI